MKKYKIVTARMLIAISLVAFGGCAGTDPRPEPSVSTSELTHVSESPPISQSPTVVTPTMPETPSTTESQKKTIYYITYAISSAHADTIAPGVHQASKDLNCELIYLVTPDASPERRVEIQTQFLEDAVASGADAIIIRALYRDAMAEPVSRAYQAGIPIVVVDVSVVTEDFDTCLIIDNFNAGGAAAAEMLRKLRNADLSEEEPAEIAVQAAMVEPRTIRDRLDGFKAYWDENAPLQWVVLWDDIKVDEGYYDRAIENGREFLANYPNLKGVFAPNELSTEGFATVLKESNRTDITLVGFGLHNDVHELVRNEEYDISTMLYPHYMMGYDALAIALELASGGTVDEKTVDMGVYAVDIGNIDSPEVQLWINGA